MKHCGTLNMGGILYDYTELPKNVYKLLLKTTLKIYSE